MSILEKAIKTAVAVAATTGAADLVSKAVKSAKDAAESGFERQNGILRGNTIQILNDTFDLSEIHNYYLENREFIYLPIYEEVETESSILHIRGHEYNFANRYYPYASILNEKAKRMNFKSNQSDSMLMSITKEIMQTASDAVCDIKDELDRDAQSGQLVNCISADGRRFKVDLQSLPNRIIRNGEEITIDCTEGKINNEREVEIKMIPCLIIEADKYYYYFGDGVNYDDVNKLYYLLDERMKKAIEESSVNKEEPRTEEPKQAESSLEDRLRKCKTLLEQNLITKEEYDQKIQEILKEI